MKQLEKLEKQLERATDRVAKVLDKVLGKACEDEEKLTDIVTKLIVGVSILSLVAVAVFPPARFWFGTLPFVISVAIAHLVAYYLVTALLFRNKIKDAIDNYAAKNKIKENLHFYSSHFGFFIFYGIPALFTLLMVALVVPGLQVRIDTSEVPEAYWEPFLLLYIILFLIYSNVPSITVAFFIAYLIAALMLSNPEKSGFFDFLNKKDEIKKQK